MFVDVNLVQTAYTETTNGIDVIARPKFGNGETDKAFNSLFGDAEFVENSGVTISIHLEWTDEAGNLDDENCVYTTAHVVEVYDAISIEEGVVDAFALEIIGISRCESIKISIKVTSDTGVVFEKLVTNYVNPNFDANN